MQNFLTAFLATTLVVGTGLSSENIHPRSNDDTSTPVNCFTFESDERVKVIGYSSDLKCPGAVVIPEGVTSIGAAAFGNNQITSVVIPESITSFGWLAFDSDVEIIRE